MCCSSCLDPSIVLVAGGPSRKLVMGCNMRHFKLRPLLRFFVRSAGHGCGCGVSVGWSVLVAAEGCGHRQSYLPPRSESLKMESCNAEKLLRLSLLFLGVLFLLFPSFLLFNLLLVSTSTACMGAPV